MTSERGPMTPELVRAWVALIVAGGLMLMLVLGALDAITGGLPGKVSDALLGIVGILAGGVGAYLKSSLTPRGGGRHKRLR